MKRLLLSTAAVAILASGSAIAADIPRKAPTAVAYDWTGLYLGIHAGWTRIESDVLKSGASTFVNPDSDGAAFGGQIGYNFQYSNIVFGIEASASKVSSQGIEPCANPAFNCGLEVNWQADVRGRLGLAWNNWFIYGTGGIAWAEADGFTALPATFFRDSTTRSGAIYGGGVNFALSRHWIVGAEYLHADFGTKNHTYDVVYPVPVTTDTVRFRLDYKFGGRH